MATTPNLVSTLLEEGGQAQAEVAVNEIVRTQDAHIHLSIIATQAAPPGGPSEGDCYVLASSPSGDWSSGSEHDVACYKNAAWEIKTPNEGWSAHFEETDTHGFFDGTEWRAYDEVQAGYVASVTANTEFSIFYTEQAITVQELNLNAEGGGSQDVDVTIRFDADRSATGTEVVTGGTTVTTAGVNVTSFNDATIPAGRWVWAEVTHTANADEVAASIRYRRDLT